MTGEEKVAALLVGLDPKIAEATLRQLGPQVKARVTGHMLRVKNSPQRDDLVKQVLREAENVLERRSLEVASKNQAEKNTEVTKPRLLNIAVGDSPEKSVPEGATDSSRRSSGAADEKPSETDDALETLNRLDPERLAFALAGESPLAVGLVLGCLPVETAGAIFRQLGPAVRREVAVNMATSTIPSPEVVQRLVQAIVVKEKTLPATSSEANADARIKKIADLLRGLDSSDRAESLTALQERDAAVAGRVRELLYLFEDILCLDGRSVQKVLAEVDAKTLATALQKAADAIKEKIMDNMSKRAREGLAEEMSFLETLPANQIQQAQKAVADVIQRLDQAGDIVMLR